VLTGLILAVFFGSKQTEKLIPYLREYYICMVDLLFSRFYLWFTITSGEILSSEVWSI